MKELPNRISGDFSPPLSTPPGKQVRTGPLTKYRVLLQGSVVAESKTMKISLLEPAFSKTWKTTKKRFPES